MQEMVISSHFMHRISQDSSLNLYNDHSFQSKQVMIDKEVVTNDLIPLMKSACADFCEKRAAAAKRRALARFEAYGHASEDRISASEIVTEALLDKEFSRTGEKYNSRLELNKKIHALIEDKNSIQMAIPALPFKIPSPLKSRGQLPDLGEINFLLSLYEIARTLELICQNEGHAGIKVVFTIVSDGSRFDDIVNESSQTLKTYQEELFNWIGLLQIQDYVELVDYRHLLKEKLPNSTWEKKVELFRVAHESYSRALWPVFNPGDIFHSFEAATQVELDPEYGNTEGRFVSLFKSLIYTIRYKVLLEFAHLCDERQSAIYRELTAHIFQPYGSDEDTCIAGLGTTTRERLRAGMLEEAWAAAINYISEIKSDRDLPEDPILTCLPDYLRWTIHAKHGQLAIATPPILGISVQAWAGSGVFRPTSKRGIRLCTLPSLVLEGASAIPVVLWESPSQKYFNQPLFYLDAELGVSDIAMLLAALKSGYTRQRFS